MNCWKIWKWENRASYGNRWAILGAAKKLDWEDVKGGFQALVLGHVMYIIFSVSLIRSSGKSIFGVNEYLWESKEALRPVLRLVGGKGGTADMRNNNKNANNNNKHLHCWAFLKVRLTVDLILINPHCCLLAQRIIPHDFTEETIVQTSLNLSNLPEDVQQSMEKLGWERGLTPKLICLQPSLCCLFKSGGEGLASGWGRSLPRYIFCVGQSMC